MFATYIGIGLAGGALAFVHCLGMCGVFCVHLSRTGRSIDVLLRQLLWHAGRTSTYVFLGALAGFGGGWIHSLPGLPYAQNVLSCVAGSAIILMGLSLLGVPTPFRILRSTNDEGPLSSVLHHFLKEPTLAGSLVLGMATGFLPCPIVLGFLAYSAHTASVAYGMTIMAALGVGTLWSLLLLGTTGHAITNLLRRRSTVMAGVVLVLLGLTTTLRGTEVLHRMLGCPAEVQQAAADRTAPCPCCAGLDRNKAQIAQEHRP